MFTVSENKEPLKFPALLSLLSANSDDKLDAVEK